MLSKKLEKLDLPLGDSKSSCSWLLLLLAPRGDGERAPPSTNPNILWIRAPRSSPWPPLAAATPVLPSFPSPSPSSSLLECVRECREREGV